MKTIPELLQVVLNANAALAQQFMDVLSQILPEFQYAAKKKKQVDPQYFESVKQWLEQRGYTLELTSGYIWVYSPDPIRPVVDEQDRKVLLALGFQCRQQRDQVRHRPVWWMLRPDYVAPQRTGKRYSDRERHARYPNLA